MITPLDIQNKEFSKSFRGYSQDEVDGFLDEIISEYERLYIENQDLEKLVDDLKEELKKYREIEETLKETLIIAKSTGEDIIKNAREKAELIIADSELQVINDNHRAKKEREKITEETNKLEIEFNAIKNKYKTFLQSQLNSIEEFDKVIEVKNENIEA